MNLSVSDICSDLEKELGVRFSPEVKATIGHLAVKKTVLAAEDLEAFAQHGKRTNVTAEDVKLLTRRNPNLVIKLLLYKGLGSIELKLFFCNIAENLFEFSSKRSYNQNFKWS